MKVVRKTINYPFAISYEDDLYLSMGAVTVLSDLNNIHDKVYNIPSTFGEIYKYVDESDEIILLKGKVLFNIVNGIAGFEEVFNDEKIIFDKNTNTFKASNIENFLLFNQLDRVSFLNVSRFISEVILRQNEYVYLNLFDTRNLLSSNLYVLRNLLKLSLNNVAGVEKVLKTHPEIIFHNISNKDFCLKNDGELTKVVEMPKFAIETLNLPHYKNCYNIFQTISKDLGSDNLKMMIEFIDAYQFHFANNIYSAASTVKRTFENFYEILTMEPSYKMKVLQNYIIRQNVHFGYFSFPDTEIGLLRDYVSMCKRYGFELERYPSFLSKTHDVVSNNASLLEAKEKDAMFIKAVQDYEQFKYKGKEYSVIVPNNVESLIIEGNTLSHCVGSYVDRVINGSSKIFFIRKNEEIDKPYVTLELDDRNNLVQIRGSHNSEPAIEVKDFSKKWLKFVHGRKN